MAFNGNGIYNLPNPEYPAVSGETIYAGNWNTILEDIADALSNCIAKDGQTSITGNINFNGSKAINLGLGAAAADSVTYAQCIQGTTARTGAHDYTGATIRIPTRPNGDNSNHAASTAYVDAQLIPLQSNVNLKAPIASPTFTGIPRAPHPNLADNSEQIATTYFVMQQRFSTVLPGISASTKNQVLTNDGSGALWTPNAAGNMYNYVTFGGM